MLVSPSALHKEVRERHFARSRYSTYAAGKGSVEMFRRESRLTARNLRYTLPVMLLIFAMFVVIAILSLAIGEFVVFIAFPAIIVVFLTLCRNIGIHGLDFEASEGAFAELPVASAYIHLILRSANAKAPDYSLDPVLKLVNPLIGVEEKLLYVRASLRSKLELSLQSSALKSRTDVLPSSLQKSKKLKDLGLAAVEKVTKLDRHAPLLDSLDELHQELVKTIEDLYPALDDHKVIPNGTRTALAKRVQSLIERSETTIGAAKRYLAALGHSN